MIIKITEKNAHLYKALFAKAYQALEKAGKLTVTHPEGRFLTLEEYFAHMADLLALDPNYMMLPLDETPFAINADTRAISAPKIVVLQKDQIAEMLIFTIDRYFDYMDLYDTEIYVQWTLPDGKTTGATKIEFKDIETIPGKIRLGWALDSEVTAQAGQVKYSVRFWKKGEFKEENGEIVEKVVYSLNTLTSSFTISPSLQVEINNADEVNAPIQSNLFKRSVRNGMLTGEGLDIPHPPTFGDPGLDLPAKASLKDNQLKLKAQAVVGDTGAISYKWYYKPAQDIKVTVEDKEYNFTHGTEYEFNNVMGVDDEGNDIVEKQGFYILGGEVDAGDVFEVVDPREYKNGLLSDEQYYTLDTSKNPHTYVPYPSSNTPPTDKDLYQKFTTYSVPYDNTDEDAEENSRPVTGEYCVRAVNTVGGGAPGVRENVSNPVTSGICKLISPNKPVISENLPSVKNLEKVEIKNADGEVTSVSYKVQLGVKTAKQDSSVVLSDAWSRCTYGDTWSEIARGADDAVNTLTASTPGWYKVTTSATLNRETLNTESSICKVVYGPAAPVLEYVDEAFKPSAEDQTPIVSNGEDTTILEVKKTIIPEEFGAGYDETLFSDEVTYRWEVVETNLDGSSKITDLAQRSDLLVENSMKIDETTGNIVVEVKSAGDSHVRIYKCIVTNTLNGEFASNELVFRVQ